LNTYNEIFSEKKILFIADEPELPVTVVGKEDEKGLTAKAKGLLGRNSCAGTTKPLKKIAQM